MRIPEGWSYVSDYCIRNGDYTICRYGIGESEWRYEIWMGKDQIAAGMSSSAEAIRVYVSHRTSSSST